MIISTACERELPEFQRLMARTDDFLNRDAREREGYYVTRGGNKLEEDVCRVLTVCAEGTPFEDTVRLVSGASFPDIVAKRMFGVEVKSTVGNHWTSIGSSILESTRDQNVERIYMTFGKLGRPIAFLSKPYEDCLSDIVVTHYPRYKIDMQLQEKNELTIFEKMNVDYDELRRMDNPVPVVSHYYTSLLREGESLWWASNANLEEAAAPPVLRLRTSLSPEEKNYYTVQGYALFPEIFNPATTTKYQRYALWLARECSVINTNIRDQFSAGGRVDIETATGFFEKVPAVYGRVKKNCRLIKEAILEKPEEVLRECWGVSSVSDDRFEQWCRLVANQSGNTYNMYLLLCGLLSIRPLAFTPRR